LAKVDIIDNAYKALLQIDWDFPGASSDALASIHPYPARYINDIPRKLIDVLGCQSGCKILDPFCGSGTTLVEAQKQGYESVGVDINPIACLISRVKTTPLSTEFLRIAEIVQTDAEHNFDKVTTIPSIPNLDHWFKYDIQRALSAILYEIEKQNDKTVVDALKLGLSSIIVRVSNQESDTRYASKDNNYTADDVFSNFYKACKKISTAKNDCKYEVCSSEIIEQDILTVTSEQLGNKIGLVITSPPYPNAYEYWLYHKYRMWWLGFDPISVRTYEIGARPHYQKKNGQTEVDFYNQMSKVFFTTVPSLVNGGHVCFVVGRSVIKGREIDNADIIIQVASKYGLSLKANIERAIAPTKKSFNLKYGKIKTENIIVLRKSE
jgi:site-specific DNA-methyltransferase (cytosine-N4-specific)